MLLSTARSTTRSLTWHDATCTGAQFWFPIPLNKEMKQNPGEDFSIDINNDTYHFVGEMSDQARGILKRHLAEDNVTWAEFFKWDVARWVDEFLPVAVDAFFDYEDDLPRAEHEQVVTARLAEAFCSFKTALDVELRLYEEHQWYSEALRHYKIYPQNDCLEKYRGRDCSHISKWSGRAETVFPVVPPQPTNES